MNKKITNPFYGTNKWKQLSKIYKINNPLCKMCSDIGITRVVKYVDHIIPIEIDYSLRLDIDNLMSLCSKCHSHKTNRVDKQLLMGKDVLPMKGTTNNGLPTDSKHPWNNQ